MLFRSILAVAAVVLFAPSASHAQTFGTDPVQPGARLGKELTTHYQIGMVVTAQGAPCTNLYGTTPIPIDWPEQTVTVVREEISPAVQKVDYRMINGTVKQMLVSIPQLPPGTEAKAVVTVEVHRYSLLAPSEVSGFVLPNTKKLPPEMRPYLLPSPFIESGDLKVRAISKEILAEHADDNAWKKVEAIYDWVRAKITYVKGPMKNVPTVLREQTGDCEELSSLFIAICRASGVPARIVWVPDHCYPEFYLEDAEGKGQWFPCQAAGTREFGGITEHRPILQKGDNFRVPEKKGEPMRYVAEYLTGLYGKGGKPTARYIRQLVDPAAPAN